MEFKQKIENIGVRYWSYQKPVDFERYIREHLIRQTFDIAHISSESVATSINTKKHVEPKPDIKVFISYAKEDRENAIRLYKDLKNAGIRAWLDVENLLPGMSWKHEIEKAIFESQYFLTLLSSNSMTKKGFIQKELKLALNILDEIPQSEIYLIPIRLDECNPMDERLLSLHWVDMFPDWEKGIANILQSLKRLTYTEE